MALTTLSLVDEWWFQNWYTQVLIERGFRLEDAGAGAKFAVLAARAGVESHGGRKLLHLLDDELGRSGACVPMGKHRVLPAGLPALEVWDAEKQLGPAVAFLAQAQARKLAETFGLACVLVRNTNHYGWGGAYALGSMHGGFLSGNFCQGAIPIVTPVGGTRAVVGSNAISLAFETGGDRYFLWDTGTAALSWGEVQKRKIEQKSLPPNCAVDAAGVMTTDAALAASLLPAGSIGNALALLIELVAANVGAGNPQNRCAPLAQQMPGEPATSVFVHFCMKLSAFDTLDFPHGRTRLENVEAMLNAILHDNGDARLCGERKWRAQQLSAQHGGLLFTPTSIEAFRREGGLRGAAFDAEVREVQVEIGPISVASK